eukprot:2122766-Pyramimonas_sp.AAC.1
MRGHRHGGSHFAIINGSLFADLQPTNSKWGPTRAWYASWGLLELLERYGQQVPDAEFVINVLDEPQVYEWEMHKGGIAADGVRRTGRHHVHWSQGAAKGLGAPCPTFSVSRTRQALDFLWPQWNIWGEDWAGYGLREKPWRQAQKELLTYDQEHPWSNRNPTAFW